jgi:DMSO/TMAO reductase YedYZ molybdopterin-dependent catalytic subunit
MPSRRSVLRGLGGLAVAACKPESSAKGGDDTGDSDAPVVAGDDTPLEPITSNDDFYTIASSGWAPDEAWLSAWTLTIADPSGDLAALTLAEVQGAGGSEQERTLCCIGGSSERTISNARWTAIRLADLLAALGLAPSGNWILFTSGDGYATCIPASDLDAGLALAWEMNGEALPAGHGAPLRALVPGRFGQKNPKWIERIEFLDDYVDGFWESRGWSDEATYKVQSWFHEPDAYAEITWEGAWLKGTAFAGERGIAKVEVSDDAGNSWQVAEVTYAGGPGVWTQWRLAWTPSTTGEVEVWVRATAADGEVQVDAEPDGDVDLDGLEAFDRRRFIVV